MNENKVEPVPYIVHESAMAREERKEKNLVKALVLAVLLLFVSNALWLWAWTSYEYIGEEVTVESMDKGNANYIGANASGVIYNGEDNGETPR